MSPAAEDVSSQNPNPNPSLHTHSDMRPSGAGEKRPQDTQLPLNFIPGLTLSKHPFEQRQGLFMKKLNGILKCKSLHPTEFEGYTIRERFKRMGWEQLLSFDCDKIYRRVVIQWMASLSRSGDELTGIVDGKSYTITPRIIGDLLGVDTRTDLPYTRLEKVNFYSDIEENKIRWTVACKTVFGIEENAKKAQQGQGYLTSMMTPLAKVLWKIAESTCYPFPSRPYEIDLYEIHLLHALLKGDYLYSFAHLMIHMIWHMYEHRHRPCIPYGNYISEILYRLGAVSEDEYVEVVSPEYRVISVGSFPFLKFSKSPTEYIIDDRDTHQRITFPKEGTRKVPPQPQPTNQVTQTYRYMSPQTSVPNPNVEMKNLFIKFQNLIDKQSSIFQKQYDGMKTMVTNIQRQMEQRERHAQIRAHAIIWDIERQRYFYEMKQEQLRTVWNQLNGANSVDEYQFPPMSRTSLHPPQEGSPYYDPTQGDEIPKAFQPLFQDIYGPRSKKPSSSSSKKRKKCSSQ